MKIKSVLDDDGAYDSNTNFRYIKEKKIKPGIKVRNNSIVSSKNNNRLRNTKARQQTKDLLKWKKKRMYGYIHRRMMAKTAFSSIKRMFDEYTMGASSKQGKRDDDKGIIV